MKLKGAVNKIGWEPILFYLVVILNCLPVLIHPFFPTMDGPSHLYNAQLINSLALDSSPIISGHFSLNGELIPNWSGHAILSIFSIFLPALLAEKILLLIYFIGLPLAFRRLIKALAPRNEILALIILPFTYSFLFMLGFYNFSLAFIPMFLALEIWTKVRVDYGNTKGQVALGVLLIVTYFSHVIVFAVTIMLIGISFILDCMNQLSNDHESKRPTQISIISKILRIALISIIPIALAVIYFWDRTERPEPQYLEPTVLIEWILNLRPLVVYNPLEESSWIRLILFGLTLLILASTFSRLMFLRNNHYSPKSLLSHPSLAYFLGALFTGFLYFYLPDSDARAGFVSVRLCMILVLIVILWSVSIQLRSWVKYTIVILVMYANFNLVNYYDTVIKDLGDVAWQCTEIAEEIEEESVILPLNFNTNWLMPHFSNYLGIEKNVVILENYEATNDYFPVLWKNESLPMYTIGDLKPINLKCASWNIGYESGEQSPDYIFILKDESIPKNECTNDIMTEIEKHFILIKQTPNCMLFRTKHNN